MKDNFGVEIAEGQVGLHFYPSGGRAKALKVRITGFTPKRVRFEGLDDPQMTGTAIPEQFAIFSPEALGVQVPAADAAQAD